MACSSLLHWLVDVTCRGFQRVYLALYVLNVVFKQQQKRKKQKKNPTNPNKPKPKTPPKPTTLPVCVSWGVL